MKLHVKCTALVLAFALLFVKGIAQQYAVGQPMSPTVFNDVLNYKDTKIDLANFSGKTVILDFWGTLCSNCLRAFPHLDSLQQKYGDRLQVIMIDPENHNTIQKFFEDRKKLKPKYLPLATGNRKLFEAFAVDALPFSVWIDSKGIIRNITEGEKLTEQNLLSFMNRQPLNIKQALSKNVKHYKSAIVDSLRSFVQYYSYLSKWNEALRPGSTELLPDENNLRISSTGSSISRLYAKAYSEHGKYRINSSNLIIELEEPYKYILPATREEEEEWQKNYAYTYELVVPKDKKEEMYKYMQQDLDRYFGLSFKREKRNMKAMVLSLEKGTDKLKTKGGVPEYTLFESDGYRANNHKIRCIKNHEFSYLTALLQGYSEVRMKIPFLDQTDYKGNIDICLSDKCVDPFNLEQLARELSTYGLKLTIKEAEVEVYVLSK